MQAPRAGTMVAGLPREFTLKQSIEKHLGAGRERSSAGNRATVKTAFLVKIRQGKKTRAEPANRVSVRLGASGIGEEVRKHGLQAEHTTPAFQRFIQAY